MCNSVVTHHGMLIWSKRKNDDCVRQPSFYLSAGGSCELIRVTLNQGKFTHIETKTLVYLILMGMVNPGSSVSSLSQTTLTVTVAGPVIPSLSRGEVRTRLAVPSLVSILMGLFSVSVRDKVMSLPTSPEILFTKL